MVTDRQMYRVQSACKVIAKGSEMMVTVLSADYGLPDEAEGCLLQIMSFAAFVYEFSALPYFKEESNETAGITLHFIGKAIDDADINTEFLELTSMSEVFGYDLTKYRSLLRIPYNYSPADGERGNYMYELFKEYENVAKVAMKRLKPGDPQRALNEVALETERELSRHLYYEQTIGNDLFKNHYALFQEIIEKQYDRENELFG